MSFTIASDATLGIPETLSKTAGSPYRDPECPVCSEAILPNQPTLTHTANIESSDARNNACLVSFHMDCLTPWLSMSHQCAFCRGVLKRLIPEDSDDSDDEELPDIPYAEPPSDIPIPGMDGTHGMDHPYNVLVTDNANEIHRAIGLDDGHPLEGISPADEILTEIDNMWANSIENTLVSNDALVLYQDQMNLGRASRSTLYFWTQIVGATQFERLRFDPSTDDVFFVPDVAHICFVENLAQLRDHVGPRPVQDLMANGTRNIHGPFSRTIIRRILNGMQLTLGNPWYDYLEFGRSVNFHHGRYWALFFTPHESGTRQIHLVQWPESDIEDNGIQPHAFPGITQVPRPPIRDFSAEIEQDVLQAVIDANERDRNGTLSTLYDPGDFPSWVVRWQQLEDGSIVGRDPWEAVSEDDSEEDTDIAMEG